MAAWVSSGTASNVAEDDETMSSAALVGLLLVVVVAFASSDDVEQHDRSGTVAGRAPPASSRTGAQLPDGADGRLGGGVSDGRVAQCS